MDYGKKINDYKLRIKNKETLKFIEFLEIVHEWIDFLYKKRRLIEEEREKVRSIFFKKLVFEFDNVSPTELSIETHSKLKKILIKETSNLIDYVINNCSIVMSDFDLFQFNLYQIFNKEEIASMIEWARLNLEKSIITKRKEKLKRKKEQEESKKKYSEYIKSLPQRELTKLITKTMFDFNPSARTHEDRLKAIENNEKKIFNQKKKFENFERKLFDATVEAKRNAQSNVFREMGNVKTQVDKVAKKFAKKAKEFVSSEGFRKEIKKARTRISFRGEKLQEELEEKGKNWEQNFGKEVIKAKKRISGKSDELKTEVEIKGIKWKKGFSKKIKKAQKYLLQNKKNLFQEEKQKRQFIEKTGEIELEKAKKAILKEKLDFEKDVTKAEKMFYGTEKEIQEARDEFSGQRDVVKDAFIKRGSEIEGEMHGRIFKGKKIFEEEKEIAKSKFAKKADEISGKASNYMFEKRANFSAKREEARRKFLNRAGRIKGTEINKSQESETRTKMLDRSAEAQSRIQKQHDVMVEKSKIERRKMIKEMIHKKELFTYNVRFAKHNISKHAKEFGEKIEEKREEFETKQEQIVSRHKSHQKAHLIQNLLRTIRSMK